MFCPKCGAQIADNSSVCPQCGTQMSIARAATSIHKEPKCTACGAINTIKAGPILRPMDIVITILLMFLFGTGLIYLIVVLIIRSNERNREKICTQCKAKNLFTYDY